MLNKKLVGLITLVGLVLGFVGTAWAGWYNSDWGYRKKITIDYTKVGTTLTNFAVLVSVTDADLKDTANGGHVGQSDGGDILFTNSSGTKLDHELEKYTNTTGELVAWVEVDSLSSTANTDIYIYYGNASAADQWNMNGTWDEGGSASIKIVQHLQETDIDGGSGDIKDSTSNANNGTKKAANEPIEADAQIAKGQSFDGVDDYVGVGAATTINNLTSFTYAMWIYPQASAQVSPRLFEKAPKYWYLKTTTHELRFDVGMSITTAAVYSTETLPANAWSFVVATFDSNFMPREYINGVEVSYVTQTQGVGTVSNDSASNLLIGNSPGFNRPFNGTIDEVRIYNRALSAEEITTQYNNQNSPSTFYSVGGEVGITSLLKVTKDANKKEVVVGDVVTYTITIQNETASDVTNVYLEDKIPAGFKYISGKAILDNIAISDPTGNRPLTFNIGTVSANSTRTLKYQLVVGSGVTFGNYENSAWAKYSDGTVISNKATETVKVVPEGIKQA
jgi:MSHA biogenesis protein MshQ